MIVAQALANQKLVLDQITALNTTTSKLIESTSELLATQSVDINKQAASTTIGLESLRDRVQQHLPVDGRRSTRSRRRPSTRWPRRSPRSKTEIDKSQAYLARVRASEARDASGGSDVLDLGDKPRT